MKRAAYPLPVVISFVRLMNFHRLNQEAGIIEGESVRYFVGTFADVEQREAKALKELQPAAIVNIDCDLYDSARAALEIGARKLVQGTVLLFDDWNTFAAKQSAGERRALKEFLQNHPEFQIESWFPYEFVGQAFLVHRNKIEQ